MWNLASKLIVQQFATICRRDYVFEDTFHQLSLRTPEELRGRMLIHFMNEEGIDAGGVTREWFLILTREIFKAGPPLTTRVYIDTDVHCSLTTI